MKPDLPPPLRSSATGATLTSRDDRLVAAGRVYPIIDGVSAVIASDRKLAAPIDDRAVTAEYQGACPTPDVV